MKLFTFVSLLKNLGKILLGTSKQISKRWIRGKHFGSHSERLLNNKLIYIA